MILTSEQIKIRLKKLGIHPDKWLGQHFLIDQEVLDDIMATAEQWLEPGATILEVGPGLGVLTSELVHLPNKIISVEKDPVLAQHLAEFLGNPENLEVVQGDILRLLDDTHVISSEARDPASDRFTEFLAYARNDSWHVIANIPYAISSPLLRLLTALPHPPHHILVLVQKEMAERVCAKSGNAERGLLTVLLEIMAESRIIRTVSPSTFWPPPKVESALLELTTRSQPLVPNNKMKAVTRLAIMGFAAKRKQLSNSLAGGLGISQADVRQKLAATGIDPSRRAETLSVEEWLKLTEVL